MPLVNGTRGPLSPARGANAWLALALAAAEADRAPAFLIWQKDLLHFERLSSSAQVLAAGG